MSRLWAAVLDRRPHLGRRSSPHVGPGRGEQRPPAWSKGRGWRPAGTSRRNRRRRSRRPHTPHVRQTPRHPPRSRLSTRGAGMDATPGAAPPNLWRSTTAAFRNGEVFGTFGPSRASRLVIVSFYIERWRRPIVVTAVHRGLEPNPRGAPMTRRPLCGHNRFRIDVRQHPPHRRMQ